MYKKYYATLFLVIIFLTACNDRIIDEAEGIQQLKDNEVIEQEDLRDKQMEALKENETSIHEAVEIALEQREEKSKVEIAENIVEKEKFTNEEEFAQYVAKIMYDFQTQEMTAEEYYNFIMNHGSRVLLSNFDEVNKNLTIEGFSSSQNKMNEHDLEYRGYSLSEITLDEPEIYGYFYRTVIRGEEELNFLTAIVRQGDKWKFDSDVPSIGYKEKEGNSE